MSQNTPPPEDSLWVGKVFFIYTREVRELTVEDQISFNPYSNMDFPQFFLCISKAVCTQCISKYAH